MCAGTVQTSGGKSPRGQKWRSDSAPPQRRARAQHATPEPLPALAREHAAHDPARITAHRSPDPQRSTAPYSQHLVQHHTQSMHAHNPLPAFGRRHPACRRDSKGLTHVHPVAQVKQRRTREAAAQQAQQAGDTALSEQTVHDMSQHLTVEDQEQPVRATSEQARTLRARQRQHRRAQTQRKRAHERGPHTGPQRSWNSAELCLKPPCQISVVNVICEYTSCKNNKKHHEGP